MSDNDQRHLASLELLRTKAVEYRRTLVEALKKDVLAASNECKSRGLSRHKISLMLLVKRSWKRSTNPLQVHKPGRPILSITANSLGEAIGFE